MEYVLRVSYMTLYNFIGQSQPAEVACLKALVDSQGRHEADLPDTGSMYRSCGGRHGSCPCS